MFLNSRLEQTKKISSSLTWNLRTFYLRKKLLLFKIIFLGEEKKYIGYRIGYITFVFPGN